MRIKDQAICLRAFDYSETSQVVHFFTRENGVVKLLAKGSKRKKSKSGGTMDLMDEGELLCSTKNSGQGLGILMEFSQTESRMILRHDIGRLYSGLYMLELTANLLAEADPHPEAFDLLHNALARLNQEDAPVQAVLAYFQWRILRHAGLMGDFSRCVACGTVRKKRPGVRTAGCYFSSSQGGLLCRNCQAGYAEKTFIDADALEGLDCLAEAQARRTKVEFTERQVRGVNRLLSYHASYQLSKPLKLAKHVLR